MAINYTSLLALIQPVDGTEVSVWGDDVNNGVSSILDVAVAGTQNLTTDANVTLTITQATSSGTNLTGTSAQYAIILLSGARTATRTVTLPASSKTYTVINSTTGGYAQTVGGLTIAVGEAAQIVYNIATTAWVKASTFSGAGVFSTVTATAATSGSSNLGAFNYGTLSFSDTGIVQSAQTSVNSYFQNVIQNTSAGTQASAEFIAYNDQGTASTNYATVGINSSGYSGTGSINAPGYGYFLTASTDLVLGTIGANGIHFTTNSSATDALAISSAGAVSLPGGTANGVAYLNGSKVLTTGSALTFDGTNLSLLPSGYSVFGASSAEQMRLTSTGLGIGTSSPGYRLDVNGVTRLGAGTPAILAGVGGAFAAGQGELYTISTNTMGIGTTGAAALRLYTNSTLQATLDSNGSFFVGSSNVVPDTGVCLLGPGTTSSPRINIGHTSGTTSGNPYAYFYYSSTAIGSITQSGTTAVLYNVTSDQRLKKNVVDAPEFGNVIDSLQVRSFDWKTDQTHHRAGFIAQELVTVAPEAVYQPADPEEMMAVDYSKLVPMLVKEIQSLRARLKAANI